jgi:nucleotidyltransferase/DNA polymerase involved in DNA repair
MAKDTSRKANNELLSLMNVGTATYKDLQLLEINSIHQLADACADELYTRLQRITEQSHDPCVWDIFAAAINEARTGKKQPWWEWTKIRKKRQIEGTFCT